LSVKAVVNITSPFHAPASTREPVWRFTVAQYHRMVQLGILTEDDPVELLAGWLVQKKTKNPPHRVATRLVRDALEAIVPDGWYVETQEPITLAESEPEPDVAIILGNTRDYLDRHPGATEVALVVEVSDSTLERDQLRCCRKGRTLKQTIYAQAGIPMYWIVNLSDRTLEVYSDPDSTGTYRTQQSIAEGAIAVTIAGKTVGTIEIQQLLLG
jgi:Uma2 family endonuclease